MNQKDNYDYSSYQSVNESIHQLKNAKTIKYNGDIDNKRHEFETFTCPEAN